MLESGQIDIALGLLGMPGKLRQRRLFDYDLACIAQRSHPVCKERISRAQFLEYPQIAISRAGELADQYDETLSRLKLRRNIVLSLSHYLIAAHVVASTDLIALLPAPAVNRLAVQFDIQVLEKGFQMPNFTSTMYWHERYHLDPEARWFRELAIEFCRSGDFSTKPV